METGTSNSFSYSSTLAPLGAQAAGEAPLRDCVQLKPLSTVADVHLACKRLGLCTGDLVRAEARPASGTKLPYIARRGAAG